MQVVPVATGILRRPDGRVLLDLRPEGRPWPGYWEFPGGKIEPGETPENALQRELQEELGIRVRRFHPLRILEHAYPERMVRLHCYAVDQWEGEPEGREGQELGWWKPWEIPALKGLPANRPLVADLLSEILPQPPVWLIADPSRVEPERFFQALDAVLEAGLRGMVLRCGTGLPRKIADVLPEWLENARAGGVQAFLNHPAPVPSWPVAGQHLPEARLRAREIPEGSFGVSCHSAEALDLAARHGARYAFLSPLFPTATHPDVPALGVERFAALAGESPLPVLALGGLVPERAGAARAAGARGIAVLSGILESSDPAAAARAFLAAWNPACPSIP